MEPMKIAVFSDVHVGSGARAKDLCPPPRNKGKVDDKYVDKFLGFIREFKLRADYLLIPGDITESAQPEEVQLASDLVNAVSDALGVPPSQVAIVPGNHDVDWAGLTPEDPTGYRWKHRYDTINGEEFIFRTIFATGGSKILADPHFDCWKFGNLVVVGYNSAHHDKPNADHFGFIMPANLDAMRESLNGSAFSQDVIKVFLVHHHPFTYAQGPFMIPDDSIMVNSDLLCAILREFRFDILIHGHKHIPRFLTLSLEGTAPVAVLSSGSFSAELDTKWAGSINNQFHIIDIKDRDGEENMILGHVKSWAYNCMRGWEPSIRESTGISHIEPFGTYFLPERTKTLLRPIIAERLTQADYVEWSWVINKLPQLKYLRPENITRALDEIAPDFGCRRMHKDPEKIILLKDI